MRGSQLNATCTPASHTHKHTHKLMPVLTHGEFDKDDPSTWRRPLVKSSIRLSPRNARAVVMISHPKTQQNGHSNSFCLCCFAWIVKSMSESHTQLASHSEILSHTHAYTLTHRTLHTHHARRSQAIASSKGVLLKRTSYFNDALYLRQVSGETTHHLIAHPTVHL